MTDVDIIRGKTIKVGDTDPPLRIQCLDSLGNPYNLSGYSADIKIRRSDSDTNKIDGSATVDDASRGIIEYNWSSGDTDTSGTFEGEITANDGSGSTVTFPSQDFFEILVLDGL